MVALLVRLNTAVMNHHDQKQVEEERVYSVYTFKSQSITEGNQDRILEAGANVELIGGVAYLILMACLACFLTEPGQPTWGWDHQYYWAFPINH